MSEIEDYTKANQIVQPDVWLEKSGVLDKMKFIINDAVKRDVVSILKAYRAYIYEAEVRPEIQYHGEEIPLDQS